MRTHEANNRLPFIPEGVQVTNSNDINSINEFGQNNFDQKQNYNREFINSEANVSYEESEDEEFPEISNVGDGGYGWLVVFCSFCCLTFVDGFGTSYSLLLNPFCSKNIPCIGYSEMGNDLGVYSRTLMLLPHGFLLGLNLFVGPFVSALSSVISFRYVSMFGAFLVAISCYFASIASDFYLFTGMSIFIGIGSGFIYLPAIAVVGQWFQTKRSLAVGITLCGVGVGELIGGLLMTQLTEKYGWRFVLFIMSCCAFQLMIISALFRPIETHSIIENNRRIKKNEQAFRHKIYLEEKAKKLDLANAKKMEKKRLKQLEEEERFAKRRALTEKAKNLTPTRGTIMQKIIEEKNRQRTTSVGSLDGMFINQDNELIPHPYGERNFNLISKISETAMASLEQRFGLNRNNDDIQDISTSKVLVTALNSDKKLVSIHVPEEPIPMKVPLDKLVQEYVQSQMVLHSNKSANPVKSQQSSEKNSIDIHNNNGQKSQIDSDSILPSNVNSESEALFTSNANQEADLEGTKELAVDVEDNASLANSLSEFNTPPASSPGFPDDVNDDVILLEQSTGITGKSIAAIAAEQVLDPETKAVIKEQIFNEFISYQANEEVPISGVGANTEDNVDADDDGGGGGGLTKSMAGQLESIDRNVNVLESLLTYKINNANCTSIKSSKSQKSHVQSSLIVSISTGMAGAPCPTKIITKSRHAMMDQLEDNEVTESSLLLANNNSNSNACVDKSLPGVIQQENENKHQNVLPGGGGALVMPISSHEFESDPGSLNCASNSSRPQSRVKFILIFLGDILNPRIFTSYKFLFLILSSVLGIFGFVIPIFFIPDYVNTLIDSSNANHNSQSKNNMAGYLLSTIGCSNCIGRLIATIYIEKFNSQLNSMNVNSACLFICCLLIGLVPLVTFNYFLLIFIIFILFGIFSSIFMSLKNILVVELIGYERLTNTFGFLLLTQGVTIVMAAIVTSVIFDTLAGIKIEIIPDLKTTHVLRETLLYTGLSMLSPASVTFFIASLIFLLASLASLMLIKLHKTPSSVKVIESTMQMNPDITGDENQSNLAVVSNSNETSKGHKYDDLDPVKEEDNEDDL